MIDIDPNDIVVARRASDSRFVIFTSTDTRPPWPLRWWGVVADIGGDGFGFLVRLDADAAPDGWTVARCGGFHLPLCPDVESLGEGVTPEQLLIVLDQLMLDATRAFPHALGIWACRRRVAAEVRRAAAARPGGAPSTTAD